MNTPIPIVLRHSRQLLSTTPGKPAPWRVVEKYFGLKERHRKLLTNKAGYVCTDTTKMKVFTHYEKLVGVPPLPEFVQEWRKKLYELKSRPGNGELHQFLFTWDGFFNVAMADRPADVAVVGYCKQLMYITMALQSGGMGNWFSIRDSLEKAELASEKSIRDLKAWEVDPNIGDKDRKTIAWLNNIVFLNWLQTIVERQKLNFHRTREEVTALLLKENVMDVLDKALNANQFFWQLAYNGLEYASFLEDEANCWRFYNHLLTLDPGFESLGYSPGEVVPIALEPNMKFFRDLHTTKTSQITKH